MKKQIALITVILLNCINSFPILSQNLELEWVKQTGSIGGDVSSSITVDHEGNIYTCGRFSDTTDFDPGSGVFNLHPHTSTDIFIQKLDSNGSFIWAKQIHTYNYSSYDRISSIAVDTLGNVFATGAFQGTLDFDPGTGTALRTIISGETGFYILKLDSNGEFEWVKTMNKSSDRHLVYMDIDPFGNLYITGFFRHTVDFDFGPDVYNMTSTTYGNYFILKLDINGDFVWAKQLGSSYDDFYITSIVCDENENVYTSGHFGGIKDFDPDTSVVNLTSAGDFDIFVLKLDTLGNFIWVDQFGGTNKKSSNALTIDDSNNVYITGRFVGTVDFDPGPGITELTTYSSQDSYILKLNSNGNLTWVKQMNGIHDFSGVVVIPKSAGLSIVTDHYGNVYTTGHFIGDIDLDPGPDTSFFSSEALYDPKDIYIQKLDPNGDFVWGGQINGTRYDTYISITLDHLQNILCFGSFDNITDFDPGTGITNLTSLGYNDIFLQKLTQCNTPLIPDTTTLPIINGICAINQPYIPTASNNCVEELNGISSIPFPILDQSITEIVWTYNDGYGNTATQTQAINWTTLDITTNLNGFTITASNTNATYQWLDCNDNTPINGENNAGFTALENGNYAVEITENGCVDTSACITIAGIGVNEFTDLKLAVYPNPSSSLFNITFKKEVEHAELIVSNTLKQIVYSSEIKQTSHANIDLKYQPSGIYFLTIKSDSGQKTIQLIKE